MKLKSWLVSPVLGVGDMRRAAEYYRDVLGFTLDPVDGVFQPTSDEPGGVVDALDALHADLVRRGAVITQGPRMAPYGIRELEVEDLNGYRLTFGELVP